MSYLLELAKLVVLALGLERECNLLNQARPGTIAKSLGLSYHSLLSYYTSSTA
jgi:hypothetical protein